MKNKGVTRRLEKEIMEAWASTTTSAKLLAESLKSKMQAVKTRLIILSLLSQDRKTLLGCISNKCGALLGNHHHCNRKLPQVEEDHDLLLVDVDDHKTSCKAIVHSCNSSNNVTQNATVANPLQTEEDEEHWHLDRDREEDGNHGSVDDDKYLTDLKHSLEFDKLNFDLEDEESRGGSPTEPVKAGELITRLPLEDEIDEVADLFIRRFHRQMRIEAVTEAAHLPTPGGDAPAKPLSNLI